MHRTNALLRLLTGVWLGLQATVWLGAPIADAFAGHADAVVAHWEDAQDDSCPPLHGTDDCQICQQVVAAAFVAPAARVAVALERRSATPTAVADLGTWSPGRRGTPHPRGPPRA